jgi:hypothetical protein
MRRSVRPATCALYKTIDVGLHDACLFLLALLEDARDSRDEFRNLDAELLVALATLLHDLLWE